MNRLDKFPYPFKEDVYRYSNNSIILEQETSVEITLNYENEINLKRNLLINNYSRCYQSSSHTKKVQWEVVELLLEHLTHYYPNMFSLKKSNNKWIFHNNILDESQEFIFGDESSLQQEPLDFIGRHVQEDLLIMTQRDGDLFLDAGQLCFPANWSLAFNLGMSFKDIHRPIPGFKEEGLDDRILTFLLGLEAGNPWWRKNWSLMAGNRLDTSLETFNEWGQNRKKVTKENAGEFVHLRVEVQKLFRLPRSNSILFTIHSHVLPLSDFISKREWLEQFYHILSELPPHIVDYKGISLFKDEVLAYLKEQLESRDGK
ncbi:MULTISPECIES: heme-dependent oxidative N-demethylase family protein [Bacillus]|uniref:heme-dependent oxidative N-demethylase family protein n=1 Tax=Bacillus TaxID=1386 RepID=UPI000BB8E4A8|nr:MULTISPECIES: DUF3445 domain-containing protein [Bacillus]